MKKTNAFNLLTVWLGIVLLPLSTMASTIHFKTDFDDGDLSGWTRYTGGGGTANTTTDQFVGDSGQSFHLISPDSASGMAFTPEMWSSFDHGNYIATFDLFLPADADYTSFTLFSGGTTSSIHNRLGPTFGLYDNDSFIDVSQPSEEGGTLYDVVEVQRDTWIPVKVIVGSGDDFDLYFNNVFVGTYYSLSPTSEYNEFYMGASSTSGRFGELYMDNLQIIPEPSSLLLVLAAGSGVMLSRRRGLHRRRL